MDVNRIKIPLKMKNKVQYRKKYYKMRKKASLYLVLCTKSTTWT